MAFDPNEQHCSNSNDKTAQSSTSTSTSIDFFTQFLHEQLSSTLRTKSTVSQSLDPSYPNIIVTMSGTQGGSSTDWNDVLKQSSALGILKPDLFPYGGGTSSGSSSGSNNGGSSSGGSSNTSGNSGGSR
ncbi:hypothetical protein VTK26DRAFT_8210 [Humicola hyalothermophila]